MSARARAAMGERDQNHTEIVQRYEQHFCKVYDTSTVGGGFPDTVVRIQTREGHVLQLVEIKTEDGSLNSAQELFHGAWGPRCCTTVRNVQDVDRHIQQVKARYV
jgi:hypothetical protein